MAKKLCNLRKYGGSAGATIDITDYLSQSQGQNANTINCKIGDIFIGAIIGTPDTPTNAVDVTNEYSITTYGQASLTNMKIYKATATSVTFPRQSTGNAYSNIWRITS